MLKNNLGTLQPICNNKISNRLYSVRDAVRRPVRSRAHAQWGHVGQKSNTFHVLQKTKNKCQKIILAMRFTDIRHDLPMDSFLQRKIKEYLTIGLCSVSGDYTDTL